MAELKKCPFCGSEPTVRIYKGKDGWRDRYAVLCRYDEGGCGAESGLYHYEAELKRAKGIIRACNRVLGYLLACEIKTISIRNEVKTLLKNITEYLSGGDEND